eukprot:768785-Hanusia_phi.AAC.7
MSCFAGKQTSWQSKLKKKEKREKSRGVDLLFLGHLPPSQPPSPLSPPPPPFSSYSSSLLRLLVSPPCSHPPPSSTGFSSTSRFLFTDQIRQDHLERDDQMR